jgi:DNA-binding transcriptional MerR regulator
VSTHSIGEVLNRLKDEFEDITISKIRFLEAEGLIQPDRTESGYRQFTDGDVERLRYVLRSQRDRYLPLKVIKDELQRIDAGLPVQPSTADPDPVEVAVLREETVSSADQGPALLAAPATDIQLTATELAEAAGLQIADIRALEDHGVLVGDRYDGDALRLARVAADLLEAGLEPRHLRMFVQFAERQSALVEQLVVPLLRQRNPEARRSARDRAERLGERGVALHRLLLGQRLRKILHP